MSLIVHKPSFLGFIEMLAARRHRSVTYIDAFKCQSGIVMSADTQESWGDYKNYIEKLAIVEDRSYPLAIGGAGIGDLIDPMLQDVVERASAQKPATARDLQAMLKESIEAVYNLDLPWLAVQKAERSPMFLVAAKPPDDDFCIFLIKGRRLKRENMTRASIGYGTPAVDTLFERMYRANLPMQQAVMLAIYLVSQAKKYAEGVGGATSVVVVRDNGAYFDYPPYVENSEKRVEEFLKLTDSLFLASVDGSIPPSIFPSILEKFGSDVSDLRKKYLDQSASITFGRLFSDPMFPGEPYAKLFPGAVIEFGTRGINTRETTPEENERNRMMWEAAKEGNNRLALAQFNELIKDKQIEYAGEESIQVRGTAGLVAASEDSES